jgi:hypothetical protein
MGRDSRIWKCQGDKLSGHLLGLIASNLRRPHFRFDPVLEPDQVLLQHVVFEGHFISHEHFEGQPPGHVVASVSGTLQRQFGQVVHGTIHLKVSLRVISSLSRLYLSVSMASATFDAPTFFDDLEVVHLAHLVCP